MKKVNKAGQSDSTNLKSKSYAMAYFNWVILPLLKIYGYGHTESYLMPFFQRYHVGPLSNYNSNLAKEIGFCKYFGNFEPHQISK